MFIGVGFSALYVGPKKVLYKSKIFLRSIAEKMVGGTAQKSSAICIQYGGEAARERAQWARKAKNTD